jgi:predicted O-linked N-acetylglucosamine transferase (SPINDLY family)
VDGFRGEADAIQGRLEDMPFAAVVEAIERAGPALPGAAEIRLYQDWLDANAGRSPHLFAAWFNIGVALARDGDRARAVIAYRNALALRPDFHAAAINLGLSLEALGQTEEALRIWAGALQPDEARTGLLNHRARLLEQLGRLAEAEACLRASLATDPEQPDAIQHFVHIRQKRCAWPVLPDDLPGLPAATLRHRAGPLGILALTDDVDAQRAATEAWIARKTHPRPIRLSPPDGYSHPRIRVGYLSSDFCRHAMSFLIAELFERHDRDRFEVFGYCSSPEDGSEIRRRVIAGFDHHRIIREMSDEQAARLIRADEIDILIDLNGLTAGARLDIARWRPAPVQATYLGFIGPVPLPEFDYLFCDDYVIPPDQAARYRPRPLAIAETYQANDSRRRIGPAVSRAAEGLPDERFVLCCFSNHYKITADIFSAWMAILRAAPGAVLWLAHDPASRDNLLRAAIDAGVEPGRIKLAERCDPDRYMARLALADLFLDTFPYNAGTIASDAIRMRLPLVTLRGRAFAARMAARLLDAIGATQGISDTLPDYVATATRLASDPAAYAGYKALFTEAAWRGTIGDSARFTAAFEATLSRIVLRPRG